MIVTTAELGELLNLTERHIYNLEKAGVLSKENKNEWNAAKNIQAYTLYKIDLEAVDSDIKQVRTRRELAEARLKELMYKEKMQVLIPLENIAKELEDIAVTISNKLYALPQILKRKCALKAEVIKVLDSEIETILKELKDPNIYANKNDEVKSKLEAQKQLESLET